MNQQTKLKLAKDSIVYKMRAGISFEEIFTQVDDYRWMCSTEIDTKEVDDDGKEIMEEVWIELALKAKKNYKYEDYFYELEEFESEKEIKNKKDKNK